MDIAKLKKIADRNEVPVNSRGSRKRIPPFYYDSLRHALGHYFNTFNTHNFSYDAYAEGLCDRNIGILQVQFLDADNTVLAMISFERFFELFLKEILRKTNRNLTFISHDRLKGKNSIQDLLNKIQTKEFKPKVYSDSGKKLQIPFRETIERFYGLIDLCKSGSTDRIVKKFSKILKKYSFFDSDGYKATMELLNWYRDRILHSGVKLPNLWLLDYIISQRVMPIVKNIIDIEKDNLGDSLFYIKTLTGINIIDRFIEVKYEFSDLKKEEKTQEIFEKLLHLGHLKELGRASLNMDFFTRNNWQAKYEYNYKDPKGRGKRFALAESEHEDFKGIKKCLCCDVDSLVLYKKTIDWPFEENQKLDIYWVKCYTCDYHLRFNAGEPRYFNLYSELIFT